MRQSLAWTPHAPGALAPRIGTIDLWTWDIAAPRSDDRALLTDDERARADRLVIPAKGASWTASRAGLRRVLGGYLQRDPAALRFVTGTHGKPALSDGALAFNLSHSGTKAVLAVAVEPTRLGVDVEQARGGRAFESIARNFFAAPEREHLLATEVAARAAVFYRYWTCKEAYLKAWGTGLTFASSRFCVDLAPNEGGDDARVDRTEMPGDDDPATWRFRIFAVDPEHPVALCWDGGPREIRAATLRL